MTAFNCEYPFHRGDRHVQHPYDQYVKKSTYRRVDGQKRVHEKALMNICRRCVELDAGGNVRDVNQGSLL